MDIQKAQRLSQHLSLICDMVAFPDISGHLIESGIISPTENDELLNKLSSEGNIMAMNEVLTMVTLRRRGFDILLNALRKSDYAWVAEQLDPGKIYSAPINAAPDGKLQDILTSVRKRISRKSESIVSSQSNGEDDTLFMSYRDDCPIDIPVKPSYYKNLFQEEKEDDKPLFADSTNTPIEPLMLQPLAEPVDSRLLLENLTLDNVADSFHSNKMNQAVVYNVTPKDIGKETVEEYFIKLAKRAKVPSPMVKDLKVLRSGKISKAKATKNKVKIQFKSETGRNAFVENLNQFIANVEPSDALYQSVSRMKVSFPKKGIKRVFTMRGNDRKKPSSSHNGESRQSNWYQQSLSFMKWRKL